LRTVVKIFLGVMLAGVVLIVGCFALVGYGLDEGVKEVERDENRNAISNREARRVKLGTAKEDVIAKLGEPRDT
jgi:outer membrane protein assembly factor BamE (lipoprotein component of BamABCDE complex)